VNTAAVTANTELLLIQLISEPKVKKTAKASKTIRASKRKAKLRAKHRRQPARATA
jgi:hypothetical protein